MQTPRPADRLPVVLLGDLMLIPKPKRTLMESVSRDIALAVEDSSFGRKDEEPTRLRFCDVHFYFIFMTSRLGQGIDNWWRYGHVRKNPDGGLNTDADIRRNEFVALGQLDDCMLLLISQASRVMCLVRRRLELIKKRARENEDDWPECGGYWK